MINLFTKYKDVFLIPLIVLTGIVAYFALSLFENTEELRRYLIIITIIIGSFQLFEDTLRSILKADFALDYIAITAILLGVITGEFIAASIIVLMLAGGNALEKYANAKAKSSLQKLKDRIPNFVMVIENGQQKTIDIAEIKINEIILVKKGEVVGLDGLLQSESTNIDESSLTGEANPVEKFKGDLIRSGTVNLGNVIEIKVTKTANESTYKKITDLVIKAQIRKPILQKWQIDIA